MMTVPVRGKILERRGDQRTRQGASARSEICGKRRRLRRTATYGQRSDAIDKLGVTGSSKYRPLMKAPGTGLFSSVKEA